MDRQKAGVKTIIYYNKYLDASAVRRGAGLQERIEPGQRDVVRLAAVTHGRRQHQGADGAYVQVHDREALLADQTAMRHALGQEVIKGDSLIHGVVPGPPGFPRRGGKPPLGVCALQVNNPPCHWRQFCASTPLLKETHIGFGALALSESGL